MCPKYSLQALLTVCSILLSLIHVLANCPDLDGSPGVLYKNYCHYFNLESEYTYDQCRDLCQSYGATLLCTTDEGTNTFFSSEISGLTWVGYNAVDKSYLADCSSTYDPSPHYLNSAANYRTASVLIPNTGGWYYACPVPCNGSPELYSCACSSILPLDYRVREAVNPQIAVVCEGGGCSSSANSTAAMEDVDSTFESSKINQQIQSTIRRSEDFIRRYLDAGIQRINSMKSELNATLTEQRSMKQFLTKFVVDRFNDYVSARDSLKRKLEDATTSARLNTEL